jgi:hypothetical protein
MNTLQELENRLKKLEDKIREAENRLPAHSTKPATMMPLLALEDERDEILKKIQSLQGSVNAVDDRVR